MSVREPQPRMRGMRAVVLVVAVALAACQETQVTPPSAAREVADAAASGGLQSAAAAETAREANQLALTHQIFVAADATAVPRIHERLRAQCARDRANACSIRGSSATRVEDSSGATLTLRIRNQGIGPLLATIGDAGEVTRNETTSEDVTRVVRDGAARMRMLTEYRERLLELQRTGSKDIETLMKLAEQLATVQSQLEQATAEQQHVLERVARDLVHINIGGSPANDIWQPVRAAIDDIPVVFASTLAAIISAITVLVPLSVVVVPLVWLFRRWRRRGANASG